MTLSRSSSGPAGTAGSAGWPSLGHASRSRLIFCRADSQEVLGVRWRGWQGGGQPPLWYTAASSCRGPAEAPTGSGGTPASGGWRFLAPRSARGSRGAQEARPRRRPPQCDLCSDRLRGRDSWEPSRTPGRARGQIVRRAFARPRRRSRGVEDVQSAKLQPPRSEAVKKSRAARIAARRRHLLRRASSTMSLHRLVGATRI